MGCLLRTNLPVHECLETSCNHIGTSKTTRLEKCHATVPLLSLSLPITLGRHQEPDPTQMAFPSPSLSDVADAHVMNYGNVCSLVC